MWGDWIPVIILSACVVVLMVETVSDLKVYRNTENDEKKRKEHKAEAVACLAFAIITTVFIIFYMIPNAVYYSNHPMTVSVFLKPGIRFSAYTGLSNI